ncbi:MAG: HAD family hydrolase [Clostridiales bacterium]|nr:HAD family hydrolase [Clostridiales bacterium]
MEDLLSVKREKPKMILFDYGQTLLLETKFNGIKGIEAVMEYATANKDGKSPEEIVDFMDEMNNEVGRHITNAKHLYQLEVPDISYKRYVFDYFGIEFSKSYAELEEIYWDNAAPAIKSDGVDEMLEYLYKNDIRTGVISNISMQSSLLINRINRLLPENHFEFIITSSDYVFRKPQRRIFKLALKKADLAAKDVWYCGDNAFCDVDGSSACGMLPVWYTAVLKANSMQPSCEDYIHIDNWKKLIEIIEETKKVSED